jgi:pyruvate kinase
VDVVINRMNLLWGVQPVKCTKANTAEEMVDMAEHLLEDAGYAKAQDIIGIVAGTRTKSGSTNFLRLHVLGDRLHDAPKPAVVEEVVSK